jgi:hypothetical protein
VRDGRGRVLFADGFWADDPSERALAAIGRLPRLEELEAAARGAGFRVEHAASSSQKGDAFEAAWRSGLEGSGDPEDVAFAAQRRREYEDGYRASIGLAWLVLVPV